MTEIPLIVTLSNQFTHSLINKVRTINPLTMLSQISFRGVILSCSIKKLPFDSPPTKTSNGHNIVKLGVSKTKVDIKCIAFYWPTKEILQLAISQTLMKFEALSISYIKSGDVIYEKRTSMHMAQFGQDFDLHFRKIWEWFYMIMVFSKDRWVRVTLEQFFLCDWYKFWYQIQM